jgi:hypothetical protein
LLYTIALHENSPGEIEGPNNQLLPHWPVDERGRDTIHDGTQLLNLEIIVLTTGITS